MKALVAIGIFEKDGNGDVLPVWCYPELGSDLEKVSIFRSGLQESTVPLQYSFSKFRNEWLYNFIQLNGNVTVAEEQELRSALSPKVQAFAVLVVANDYNPEKYFELGKLMAAIYLATGSPVKLLEVFLSVFAKGSFNAGKLGSFSASQHDPRSSLIATPLKDAVRLFGEEVILVWAALVMKKRVVVFSQKLGLLLKLIRAFPLFVWHRQNWDILRPFMTLSELEIADIQTAQVYCAGFTTDEVRDREDLFDVFVDVNNRSITVASHAKSDFIMTRIHKDICELLITGSEDESLSDTDFIKGLTVKVKELLAKLDSLRVDHESSSSYVDLKTLEGMKLPANVDKFLFAVATAEGMTKMQ